MMTIVMYCDHCGSEIPLSFNGGVRVRTGKRELSLHLCERDQENLREIVREFCQDGDPREVQPSLKT